MKINFAKKIILQFPRYLQLILPIVFFPCNVWSQDTTKIIKDSVKLVPDGTTGLILAIKPDDFLTKKKLPNEFEGTYTTLRVGLGFIGDAATYAQDATFKQQMDSAGLEFKSRIETRDFRVMASGVSKIRRTLSWKVGFMYDGDKKVWYLRETGVTLGVPELFGHIFIGRTKEGYSMIKVMNGHSGITAERQMALDVIPILADGIKWFGFIPKSRIFWNLGYFNDLLSKGQSFSTYSWQYVARVGWMPVYDQKNGKALHIAANIRYGRPLDGKIGLKSRPESNPAPQILNTGTFQSDHSTHIGGELYYNTGKFLAGTEVMVHRFTSATNEDHRFYGGDAFVSYLFTRGKRPYNTIGSILGFVQVEKPVFKGGWGEWELVFKYSAFDLNHGSINGGKFWRLTPMVNWYMSRVARTEFIYGYGVLDRFNMKGKLQVFQARLQLSIL